MAWGIFGAPAATTTTAVDAPAESEDLPPPAPIMSLLPQFRVFDEVLFSPESPPPSRPSSSRSLSSIVSASLPARRRSSLGSMFTRRSTRLSTVVFTPEMVQINAALAFKRRQLVDALLGLDGDFIVKIRFINAVDEFASATDRLTKDRLGKNICALFAQEGMFCIHTFEPETRRELIRGKHEALEQAKLEILIELSQHAEFMQLRYLHRVPPLPSIALEANYVV
ncbi:hypothetical protein BASA81_000065 [Batrachochytrium salamandrivorans]|nr:hypothetical protein BASA81_000065 [Batrachochytrium salamandrivorans]